MAEDFKIHFEADLDTSEVERKARDLQNKKIKIDVDSEKAKSNVDSLNQSLKTGQKTSKGFGDSLKSALGIGSAAALAYKGIRLISQAAREATESVKNIDKAITDLRIVTNENYATVSQWMQGYNEMARTLGATTTQVSDSAVTWLRQGKTAEEANKLIRDSMILSKVGMIDSASAAEYLTTAMKGYHVEVENATSIVDKLGKLDSSAAVTAGDLAQGMSKVAQMANDTGVSMNTLLGYLSAVGEVTQDVTSAGTTFKTIFSRMSDIKAEKFELVDEDGTTETLSNVEATLKNVGIDLRKTINEYNSFEDVLASLANKWGSLNSVQQAALSKAFAGVRQQNNFRVLMANYDKAKEYANLAANSAGAAEEKFGAYLDSIEAKTNTLTAAFESLATNNFSGESFKWIIEATTNIVTFIDKANVLKGVLAGLAVAGALKGFTSLASVISATAVKMTEFNNALQLVKAGNIGQQEIAQLANLTSNLSKSQLQAVLSSQALTVEQRIAILTAQGMSTAEAEAALASMGLATAEGTAAGATATFSGALKGLWATLKANPLILIASAVMVAVTAFNNYQQSIEQAKQETKEKLQKIKGEIDSLNDELKSTQSRIEELLSKDSLTLIEQNELDKLQTANDELQRQIELKERALKIAQAKNADNFVESVKSIKTSSNDKEGYGYDDSGVLRSAVAIWQSNLLGVETKSLNNEEFFNRTIKAYKTAQDELKTATGKRYDDLKSALDKFNVWLSEYTSKLHSNLEDLGEFDYNTLSDDAKNLVNYIRDVENTYLVATNSDTNKVFSNIFNSKQFEKAKKSILDLRKVSSPTLKALYNSNDDVKAMFDNMKSVGLINGEVSDSFGLLANQINSANKGFKELKAEAEVSESITQSYDKSSNLVSGVGKIFDVLKEQSAGKSISLSVFNSDEVKDYTSALEYQNGVLQLNADKVNEIVRAKTKERIEINNTNKAISQSDYLKNAAKIEQLRQKLIDKNYAEGESAETIQKSIDSLLSENSTLADNIEKYNLMTSSLEEVTGAYQNWLNSQKATQSGDMFDDTVSAINRINDTLNNESSDYYGRVGRTDYKAAVDLIIPESINEEDKEKVNNYLKSIKDLFTYDDDGNRAGLNIENFCQEAVDKGLMVLDKSTNEYKIKGQKTMQDFANGLNLSMPLVQAMFGEMEEFGGKFSWADEANKTVGDLAVTANQAAEALRKTNKDIVINLDTSKIDGTKNKVETLENTIQQMQTIKGKANVDSSEVEHANQVIEYCVRQQQELEKPIVMDVNTAKLDSKTAEIVTLLQDYKTAYNELTKQKKLGVDTSEAQKKVSALKKKISELPTNISTTLGLDTSSNSKINKSINNITADKLIKIGVDDTAIVGYNPKDKKAKVKYSVDTTEVDKYNPKNLERTLTYTIKTKGSHRLQGTANVGGTAFAGGNWSDKKGGEALVGELGAEAIVNPYNGRWYTVGDNGAEFVDIPKGSIVFNHKQTEALLKYGRISSRGKALAGGNAFVTGGISVKNAGDSTKTGGNSTDNYGNTNDGKGKSKTKTNNTDNNTDNKEKTALDKFKDWFKNLFDWIEIKLERQTDKISNYVSKAERATNSGNYKGATKNYRNAIGSTASLIGVESKAANKYQDKADYILKTAAAKGVISIKEANSIRRGVASGRLKIKNYREEIREVISNYQEFAKKADTCKKSLGELHDKIREYIKDLKDVRTAQRDATINNAQSFLTIATSNISATSKNQADVLKYKNKELDTEYNAYKKASKSSGKDVASFGNKAKKAISKAKTKEHKKYKTALKNAKKAINKGIKVSSKDLKVIKKYSLTVYNRIYAYNLAIDNQEATILEQDVFYATSYSEKMKNRADKYNNKDEKSQNNISLYKQKANNAETAEKANEYLAKASKQYDTIVKNDTNEINSYQKSLDSAANSALGAKRYASGIKKLKAKDKKAVKDFIKKIVNKVKAHKEITVGEINKLAKYHSKRYITTAFYNAVYRYYDNYQALEQAKAQKKIDEETRKTEQANIRNEQFNNLKNEFDDKINSNKTTTQLLEAKQAIKTAKGLSLTESDYTELIKQSETDVELLKNQRDILQSWLDSSGLDENSKEYQKFAEQIRSIDVSIADCEKSQIEFNNAIAQIPFDTLEKAISLFDAIKNRYSAFVSLQQALFKDEGEEPYFKQIEQEQNNAKSYAEGYELAMQKAKNAKNAIDGSGAFDGKTEKEWLEIAEEYLAKQYQAQENEKKLYNDLLEYRLKPFEKAIEQAEYLENVLKGVESLISDDMLIDKNGKLTQYGIAQIAILTSGYENARDSVKNYSDELAKLNEEYLKGELNISPEEYKKRTNDIQKAMLSSAANMKSSMKSMIDIYKNMAQKELDTLFELVDARNKSLQAKKDYYSWDKTLKDKNKDIQSLESQIAALNGIDSAAAKSKRAQLLSELAEKQEDLDDTLKDHYFEISQNSLSELKDSLKEAFDDTWDYISQDLKASAEIVARANDTASQSVSAVDGTLTNLLSFFNINKVDSGISIRNGYASGIRSVLHNESALVNEKGRELITTRKGIIAPLAKGDGVIPAELTDNLIELAQGKLYSAANIPDFDISALGNPKLETKVTQHYDNLINIEGSADAATVEDLKKFSKDFLQKSYEYTSNQISKNARKAGAKRLV